MYQVSRVSATMDVSSVQSSAKNGSSDFSIERILSSETVNKKENSETPHWLCCTRYQPPRLPRSVNNGCRARRSGRHARVPFTVSQAAALEAAYTRAPYLAPPALRALAAALQLREDRIKIWFQNRRARERREKSATINPPREVPLPPTNAAHQFALVTPDIPWLSHTNADLRTDFIVSSTLDNNLTHRSDNNESPKDFTVSPLPSSSKRSESDSEENNMLDIESVED